LFANDKNTKPIDVSNEAKALIIEKLKSNNKDLVVRTLMDITFNFDDSEWIVDRCIELIADPSEDIAGLAVTCIGHVARMHGKLDLKKVMPILTSALNDARIKGRVEDAIDDINQFI
jgi:hypothetical protein